MSVDMQPFEEFKEALGRKDSMVDFVYNLAMGDEYMLDYNLTSIPVPEQGDRKWDDPTWQAEYSAWREVYKAEETALCAKYGYEHISQNGGREGEGEYCDGVFKLGSKYYSTSWTYYSHNGCEYDYVVSNLMEVKPEQRTITAYVRV